MTQDNVISPPLDQLIAADAVGQLRRRDGLMATLGSEGDALKLDWVEGIARLLADPSKLEAMEAEARDIKARGIRHIIWAGMGGSIIAVRVLCDLGFGGGGGEIPPSSASSGASVTIHPLDSTDPAALNAIIRTVAAAKHLALPTPPSGGFLDAVRSRGASLAHAADDQRQDPPSQAAFLRALLRDVLMIGVSMGMTSEEPITHLTWFTELLEQAQLRPAEHLLVMTLPDSYLDVFAREHQAPRRPLQLDGGTGTGGRMSAPATRVFLLPAALYLTGLSDKAGQLRSVLQHAWDEYDLDLAATNPAAHPFVRLAAALSAASIDGACRLLLRMPEGWQALVSWLEQLMEESLGKGGKGVVVFDDQMLSHTAPAYHPGGMLRVRVVTGAAPVAGGDQPFILSQPSLASAEPRERLAALAASFLGWQLTMALFGYAQRIQFAGQPAVENYKARARALRTQRGPLGVVSDWRPSLRDGLLTLLAPAGTGATGPDAERRTAPRQSGPATARQEPALPASAFASALRAAAASDDSDMRAHGLSLGYLDVTINGDAPADLLSVIDQHAHAIGNTLLGVPVKLRVAPAAYHSTEQSEMDGPPNLVSLRLVARDSEACLVGSYTNTFLHAQAVSTWQAMMEAGRPCFLLVVGGSLDDAREPLLAFLSQVANALRQA